MELQELILMIPSIGYGKLFREEDKEGNWLAELLRPINVMNVARGKKNKLNRLIAVTMLLFQQVFT